MSLRVFLCEGVFRVDGLPRSGREPGMKKSVRRKRMRFLEELLYLSFLGGIGRGAINDGFVPWLRCRTLSRGTRSLNRTDKSIPYRLAREWLQQTGRMLMSSETKLAEEQTGQVLDWLAGHEEIRVCTVFDENYPARLNVLGRQRPPVLYIRGGITAWKGRESAGGAPRESDVFSSPALAVIGSRWPGEYTLIHGPAFARELARRSSMVIVSGLARGCDRTGHMAAIQNGSPTIAMMPCGPDMIVPESNRDLAARIADGRGFLMTEYPPGTPPAEYRYVERDRVTAAWSSAVVVIECGVKSGTMQTVRAALSFGKPVACWYPDGAERSGFEGNRYLLEHLGATRLHDTASVEEFLSRVCHSEQRIAEYPEQLTIF